MSARVTIQGLNELREAFRSLPDELVQDASDIVVDSASSASNEIYVAYPKGPTGTLKSRLRVDSVTSGGTVTSTVRSRAPHAWIYENGTADRRTAKGWNRGRMPKADDGHAMIPIAIKWRQRMLERLIEMVTKTGLVVTR